MILIKRFMSYLAGLSWFWLFVCAFVCGGYSQEQTVSGTGKSAGSILVRVNVTDPLNRQVAGLRKENFEVYERHEGQPITYFAQQTAPISVSIVCDLTVKKETLRKQVSEAVRPMLESLNSEDEFFLVSFDQKNAVIEIINRASSNIEKLPSFAQVLGITPLDAAIHLGMEKLKKQSEKRALVIITAADKTEIDPSAKVWEIADQPEIQVFIITIGSPEATVVKPNVRFYLLGDHGEVGYYLNLVYSELRNQYVLRFQNTSKRPAGQERKISVRLKPPNGLPKLTTKAMAYFDAR